LDLDLTGNTILASIAPNLKTQTAMEGRRKTSNAKEYKVGPKLLFQCGLVSFSGGNAFARERR
jgi:hypothetical protein